MLLAPLHAALVASALQLLQRQWQGERQPGEAEAGGGADGGGPALASSEQSRSDSLGAYWTLTLTLTLTPTRRTEEGGLVGHNCHRAQPGVHLVRVSG